MPEKRPLAAVILAAGHGKRMKSDLPKVLHPMGGRPMVVHVIGQARSSGADPIVVVVGHKKELVIPVAEKEGVAYAVQEQQLGTGHAVKAAQGALAGFSGDVLVLSGDVPLLSGETISRVVAYHQEQDAVATVITAIAPDPSGYGRVIRGEDGMLAAIREHKDCTDAEREIDEINSGIYLFRTDVLFDALDQLDNNNAQGEYYLTDVFAQFFSRGLKVAAYTGEFDEIHGVNTPDDLRSAEAIWMSRSASS